jgi:hypothetical protein
MNFGKNKRFAEKNNEKEICGRPVMAHAFASNSSLQLQLIKTFTIQ